MRTDAEIETPPNVEPVFNTFRRKPLRSFYSPREFQIGLVILAVLVAVAAWVARRGAHPDPNLFAVNEKLLSAKGKDIAVYKRPVQPWIEPGNETVASKTPSFDPFPDAVASVGWRVTAPPQMFDESNLYIKIDGRESFYKSYGFKKLHFLTLASTEKPDLTIDIELFDLGEIANALGAMTAEISSPDAEVAPTQAGLWYATRNSGFLSHGRYYARMIGSDDNELIRQKIASLKDAFVAALSGEKLPWVYAVFVGGLQISPARIQYQRENAFSFGFANDFYSATMPKGDTEVFLSRRASADEAEQLTNKFADGLAELGKRVPDALAGVALFKNNYVDTIDGVRAYGAYVIGVRLAPSVEEAIRRLNELAAQLDKVGGAANNPSSQSSPRAGEGQGGM
jgi:hypothetical protein